VREGESAEVEVIIPRKTVLELARLLPDSDEPVRVQMASGQVRLSFGAVEFISKLSRQVSRLRESRSGGQIPSSS